MDGVIITKISTLHDSSILSSMVLGRITNHLGQRETLVLSWKSLKKA